MHSPLPKQPFDMMDLYMQIHTDIHAQTGSVLARIGEERVFFAV